MALSCSRRRGPAPTRRAGTPRAPNDCRSCRAAVTRLFIAARSSVSGDWILNATSRGPSPATMLASTASDVTSQPSPKLAAFARAPNVTLKLAPSGLFSAAGARPMDANFAAYAWANDQRIDGLTGQNFSPAYREKVLGAHPHLVTAAVGPSRRLCSRAPMAAVRWSAEPLVRTQARRS